MRTLFVWIAALLITGVIISPFFWLWFLKKKNKWLYIALSSTVFLIIYTFYIFGGGSLILNIFAKISSDAYYFYDDAETVSIPIVPFLMLISPFIFTKILYDKFSLKSVIVSLLCSIAILMFMVYAFVYYIAPKAFETLLNNI